MKSKVIAEHSKFWLGDKFNPEKSFEKGSTMDLLSLAGYRRAISNFVYILSGQNIPVRFAEKSTSATDGKVIYIGGELSRGEFDPTVGLSLHEAMHIVKSDFDLVKLVWSKVPRSLIAAAKGKFTPDAVGKYAKYILNVVEDRYIDAWAYDMAPGYRGYYQALYNRYFFLDEITEGLKSDAFRTPTLRNYKFRFTNAINPASDLDALPALRKIMEMLDLPNILRPELTSPQERLDLAFAITEEIVKSVVEEMAEKKKEEHKKQKPSGGDSAQSPDDDDDSEDSDDSTDDSEESEGEVEEGEAGEEADDDSENDSDDVLGGVESSSDPIEDDPDKKDTENPSKDLSEKEIAKIEKLLEKQEAFVSREITPTAFDDVTLKNLNILEQSMVDLMRVGGEEGVPEIDCVVVKNMTRELMFSGEFPLANKYTSDKANPSAEKGVHEGVALGTMLGRRLQIRGETRTTKFTRLVKGKIDRRLLAAIGFQEENLFYQTTTDKYKNVHLHVTVDASSSMAGEKWRKAIATVVSMAKAASMITNVGMSISFRTGYAMGGRTYGQNEVVYVVLAYDSRKDKFSKILNLFPMLYPSGSTPEGLAFQAILNNIPASTHELDSYFVNLSDGEPSFSSSYFGDTAARHTKKQVGKIRENGVTVLSYFIEVEQAGERENTNSALFRTMYGKDAQFIDVQNVIQVAHTMNQKFLARDI